MKRIAVKILNTFNVDVNYVSSSRDSVIQCIMDMTGKGMMSLAMDMVDLVSKREEFDFEQIVIYERVISTGIHRSTKTSKLRPIEMALQMYKYDSVIKLIMAGADCRCLHYETLKKTWAARKLLKLLYHLGVYVNIVEGDTIYEWARRQPLKSLPELAAMAVGRNYSQHVLKKALADIVLPDAINSYLDLKHLSLVD